MPGMWVIHNCFQLLNGPVLRPFTAIGLCRSTSQNSFSPQITYKTSLEPEQRNQVAASRSWTSTDSLSVRGSAIGRGLAAVTPEMTPKHPYTAKEHRLETVLDFRGRAAKEPLPMLVGSPTHLFSRKLMKACSSAAPRPPRRSLTACSQTLSRPVVNAHTDC
uniref:RIKEN cDNA 1700113H08 gene n=1 Tax=Peromyscus maniculatus bairdii TaxID=230844 RepID=A0A8C8VZ63_PERMB